MKKLLIIVTLVTSFYSLQRINDYSELSEMIFVNSMGVDYDNNKKDCHTAVFFCDKERN